jgi:fermentation-respiration switch protein FrsA (DUF1100 family)
MVKPRNWLRFRRWSLLVLAVLVVVFVGVAWYIAGELVASANHLVGPPPADLPMESLTIPSPSGSTLAAWYFPAPGATATVILLHPIRGDRRAMLTRARLLHEAGFSTLLVDLQAHGESKGNNVTAGYLERQDVAAAVEFLRAKNPEQKLGIIGWSLGGAATLLAAPLPIDVLVLESVYPTISEAVHNRVALRLGPLHNLLAPALLVQLQPRLGISPEQLRPIDYIANVGCPVLFAAGDADQHTTLPETKRLYQAAVEPKQLVIFAGAGHGYLLAHDSLKYEREIVSFLVKHLAQNGNSN